MNVKLFITYSPRYEYREIISENMEAPTNQKELDELLHRIIKDFTEFESIMYKLQPSVFSKDPSPEYVLLQGNRLKETMIHAVVTP